MLSAVVALCVSPSAMADMEAMVVESPDSDFSFEIGLATWISTGESSWDISFRGFEPGLGAFRGRSRLEWEDLDSLLHRLHAEFRFSPVFSLSAAYGFGDIDDAEGTDTDWFDSDTGSIVLAQSVADTRGDITLIDIDGHIHLNELVDLGGLPGVWDVVVGYRYYEEDLNDRNGAMTVLLGDPVDIPFGGLDSTYRFEWSAIRLGLRGEVPVMDRVRAKGEVAGLVGIRYEGEGFWNLREDFINESPNFRHKATAGTGAELKASLAYDFTPSFYGELGFWWFRMEAEDGTDQTFFADGETGVANLDEVKTTRYGVFLGLGGRF